MFLTNMQLFTSHNVNWWTGVVWFICGLMWCFYQLFGLSFWRHPFTAEHPLVSKWCNYKSPNLFSCWNTLIKSWIAWGRVHRQQSFIFGWIIPLKETRIHEKTISKEILLWAISHVVLYIGWGRFSSKHNVLGKSISTQSPCETSPVIHTITALCRDSLISRFNVALPA